MAKPYYQDDYITIYHGDCREVLPGIEADCVVTDPPYGISYYSGYTSDVRSGGDYVNKDGSISGDNDTMLRDFVVSWCGSIPALVFGSYRAPFPLGWKQILIWDKGPAAGMGDLKIPWKPNHEPIFILGDWPGESGRGAGIIRGDNISRLSMGRKHPHEKSVSMLRKIMEPCPGTILDPFMGSGTTLRAAKDLGRKAIGIEIEEKYCEVAAKRLSQEVLPFGGES